MRRPPSSKSLHSRLLLCVAVVALLLVVVTWPVPQPRNLRRGAFPPSLIPSAIVASTLHSDSAGTPAATTVQPVADANWLPTAAEDNPVSYDEPSSSSSTTNHHHRLRLTIFTTLKPCTTESIFAAQLSAVQTWISLPLVPPPAVYIVGSDPCGERIRRRAALPSSSSSVTLLHNVADGSHGTVLLGPAIHAVRRASPSAQYYAFVNADILISPRASVALRTASETFTTFFMVGRRKGVHLTEHDRSTIDFSRAGWESAPVIREGKVDRPDAEDFFIWEASFFEKQGIQIPSFHIGRPAYDNWLVHTAIHTFQPVIDASRLFTVYHQQHDYSHIRKESDSRSSADGGGGEGSSAARTYWGVAEQKENYELALAHGGWQHGMVDFAPFEFVCSTRESEADEGGECTIDLKHGWKPLSNGEFGGMQFYTSRYRRSVVPERRAAYDEMMAKHQQKQ